MPKALEIPLPRPSLTNNAMGSVASIGGGPVQTPRRDYPCERDLDESPVREFFSNVRDWLLGPRW